jgi:hypothetical protein
LRAAGAAWQRQSWQEKQETGPALEATSLQWKLGAIHMLGKVCMATALLRLLPPLLLKNGPPQPLRIK